MEYIVLEGDSLEVLRGVASDSVDSVVTDPPYGIKFMGKKWDYAVPSVDIWRECFRVLKPGGHLLSFASTRTHHRMAVNIEDAGFEIRDMIAWVYGSGFPKSLDVSKAIDKAIDKAAGGEAGACASTDAAKQWQGWGTALKPALEPITVARKPFKGTVASNVLRCGVGVINIDGCRVPLEGDYKSKPNGRPSLTGLPDNYDPEKANQPDSVDRWPANLIHDGSEEVVSIFPQTASVASRKAVDKYEGSGVTGMMRGKSGPHNQRSDSGSAARFFYCAKASKKDRDEGLNPQAGGRVNDHPTVKPTALMRYLVRLVTPPSGRVLDPFCGSGTTGKACALEGFGFLGIDDDPKCVDISRRRIKHALDSLIWA